MASNKRQGGIKGLLLLHGEKIAISLVGLIALWMIYKATSLPRLEDKYQASKLQDQIRETSSAVKNAPWPEASSELAAEVRVAQPIDAKADIPINAKFYATSNGFDNTIIAPTVLRTDPPLLNVVAVRATGGSGLFAFADEAIRKKQQLALAAEDAERAKKEADKLEKQNNNPTNGAEGGPPRRNRGPDAGPGEGFAEVMDPAHPKRRPVQGMGVALGVQRQGGERIERAYWAIVVAKVPIREQLKLYQDAFEKARMGFDPARDFPQYMGYQVQRAEVLPGKPLEWKPVPVYDGQRPSASNKPIHPSTVGTKVIDRLNELAHLFWAGMSPDVIDPRFADYVLTFPLPPLVGRDWGSEATHPDIPLLADTPPLEEDVAPLAATSPDQPADTDDSAAFSSTGPTGTGAVGTFPSGQRMMAEGPGAGMRRFGTGMGPVPLRRASGPEGGMGPEGGGRGAYVGGPSGAAGSRTSLPKGVDFLLLRFFDFTVEPGKKYKYRATLVLADPNYNILENANVLAPEVLDRRRKEAVAAKALNRPRPDFRRIDAWSEPSPTVGIPLAGNARLVEVKPAATEKFNDEPSAKLLVESFDADENGNAIQAAKEKDLFRGSVANMVADAEYLGDGPWIDTHEKFKFVTGMTLLDVEGGKKLAKDIYTPGRALLMGSAGDLYIRNELDDKPSVEYQRMLFNQDDKYRNQGGPEGGPEGPGPQRPRSGGRPSRN